MGLFKAKHIRHASVEIVHKYWIPGRVEEFVAIFVEVLSYGYEIRQDMKFSVILPPPPPPPFPPHSHTHSHIYTHIHIHMCTNITSLSYFFKVYFASFLLIDN